uniref:Aldo-keto reductase family 1 member B10 n=1 Tax=Magallana gigas TaxID=29159 RepID=K1Q2V0_MAGGI
MDDSLTSVTLSNGLHMPSVGLGTWQSPKDELKVAVRAALDDGYRHIDTAYSYLNEDAIGEVLQEYIKSGKVKREDLFIVTKLAMIHMEPALVKRSIEMSLKKLQLDYVDLYLIHFPVQFAAMEELVDLGLTKSLGLSNCSISQVERICKISKHKPVSNQVECHIYLPQNELFDACKKLGLAVTAYAPFGSPGRFEQLREIDAPVVLEDPVITKIAKRYSKSPAHILLRNLLQRGIIVIPKSVTPHRIRSNIQVFDFSLTKEEMEDIAGIKTKRRLFAAVGLM